MTEITFADIFLILLACCVIYAILYLVHRNKKKAQKADDSTSVSATEKNQAKATEDN